MAVGAVEQAVQQVPLRRTSCPAVGARLLCRAQSLRLPELLRVDDRIVRPGCERLTLQADLAKVCAIRQYREDGPRGELGSQTSADAIVVQARGDAVDADAADV